MAEKRFDSLRLSQHYLLIRMNLDVPPKRLDFNDLRVFPGSAPPSYEGNYVTIPPSGAGMLTLREFKTAKKYKTTVDELTPELTGEIRKSLKLYPRDSLFVGRDGTGMTENAYGKMIRTAFSEHIGKPSTINAIRHAHISEFSAGKHTYTEMAREARSMGHNTDMQLQYNVVGWQSDEGGKSVESRKRN